MMNKNILLNNVIKEQNILMKTANQSRLYHIIIPKIAKNQDETNHRQAADIHMISINSLSKLTIDLIRIVYRNILNKFQNIGIKSIANLFCEFKFQRIIKNCFSFSSLRFDPINKIISITLEIQLLFIISNKLDFFFSMIEIAYVWRLN